MNLSQTFSVTAHLYVSACPVEWRLPWMKALVISGPWRLPLRPINPTLLMPLTASHTSDDDTAAALELSSPDCPDRSSFSRILRGGDDSVLCFVFCWSFIRQEGFVLY